jgi:hypothetical protein
MFDALKLELVFPCPPPQVFLLSFPQDLYEWTCRICKSVHIESTSHTSALLKFVLCFLLLHLCPSSEVIPGNDHTAYSVFLSSFTLVNFIHFKNVISRMDTRYCSHYESCFSHFRAEEIYFLITKCNGTSKCLYTFILRCLLCIVFQTTHSKYNYTHKYNHLVYLLIWHTSVLTVPPSGLLILKILRCST